MRVKVDIYLADATRRAAVRQETTRARRCFDPWSQHMHAGVTGPRTSVAAELVSSSPLDHPISSCRQMQGHSSKHFKIQGRVEVTGHIGLPIGQGNTADGAVI